VPCQKAAGNLGRSLKFLLGEPTPLVINFRMAQTRRSFVRKAPLLAAALPLMERPSFALWSQAADSAAHPAAHPGYQLFTSQDVEGIFHKLDAAPGNHDLVSSKQIPVSVTLTVEEKKTAPEFEYHEHRDHVLQVIDGTTTYELGGTPRNARQTRPGEWLAPESEGFSEVTLKKGDILLIPRSVPHRRITSDKVGFMLISATTPAS
jgi:mannose-6-phosphate isomerase-like protein (cupin superfamily)